MSRRTREINPECGLRLNQLLIENGMTQQKLADLITYNKQHISNIIRGKRSLTLDVAQKIAGAGAVFPRARIEWLLCIDDFKTQEEKEAYSRKVWEENHKAALFYDKVFRCFIDGIEDLCGYGLHSHGTDLLIGDYITVTDSAGEKVGAIPVEAFHNLQSELENYASYLIQRIVKTKMVPMPREEKEGIENG